MDSLLLENFDWDPEYLASIFDQDFYEMAEMWCGDNISDNELVCSLESAEKAIYLPVCKDISI